MLYIQTELTPILRAYDEDNKYEIKSATPPVINGETIPDALIITTVDDDRILMGAHHSIITILEKFINTGQAWLIDSKILQDLTGEPSKFFFDLTVKNFQRASPQILEILQNKNISTEFVAEQLLHNHHAVEPFMTFIEMLNGYYLYDWTE